ncbi:MAG: DUF4388 domain-containing protein [Blastocatellia bacterium]|nr:DUF4388 domain-containing protein [Blastocatellia bacterium]
MGLVGDLEYLSLVDIIQINCIARNTARLTVHFPIGDGIFYFGEGELVDARLANLVGVDAVYKALNYDKGSFRVDSGVAAPTRTIFEPWANIIMEGLRLIDEAKAGMIPDPTPIVVTTTPATTTGMTRVQNPYQSFVNDLTKINGVNGALATARDGTMQAASKLEKGEKAAMMAALAVYLLHSTQTMMKVGLFKRLTISIGPKKVSVFDQGEYLTLIEYGQNIRFETLTPHLERAFKKMEARLNNTNTSSLSGNTGLLEGFPSGPTGMLPRR